MARKGVTHGAVRSLDIFEPYVGGSGKDAGAQRPTPPQTQLDAGRPADECPYPKPFTPGFAECPAYQAIQMITMDLSDRPLGPVLTCGHLVSRLMPNTDYRWYGACGIGDAEARRRWGKSVGIGRLNKIAPQDDR
jgi:hypothetical protein